MPTDPAPPSFRDNQPGVERLLVLSDGVVAISLTLLVLQLQVPTTAQVPDPTSASELAAQRHLRRRESRGARHLSIPGRHREPAPPIPLPHKPELADRYSTPRRSQVTHRHK